ncbi:hypothetical protein JZ785_04285 [Alicyclobacillus curvatus]|nr:hypothetical protein JZ785_04285 [Alicyclobacillus curvatus]
MMLEEKIQQTSTLRSLGISELKEKPEVVHRLLHEHEESYRKTNNLTLRKLSPGLKAMIWFLRVYVLFMIVVAVIQVVHSIHPS